MSIYISHQFTNSWIHEFPPLPLSVVIHYRSRGKYIELGNKERNKMESLNIHYTLTCLLFEWPQWPKYVIHKWMETVQRSELSRNISRGFSSWFRGTFWMSRWFIFGFLTHESIIITWPLYPQLNNQLYWLHTWLSQGIAKQHTSFSHIISKYQ